MRCALILLIVLAMTGCDRPGPNFSGLTPLRVVEVESVFDIRIDGLRAEIIRVNPEWAPRLAAVAPRAVHAVERISGCRVDRLDGDQARMVAALDCGAGAPPRAPVFPDLDCELAVLDEDYGELFCRPSS